MSLIDNQQILIETIDCLVMAWEKGDQYRINIEMNKLIQAKQNLEIEMEKVEDYV